MDEFDITLIVSCIIPIASAISVLVPVLSSTKNSKKTLSDKMDLIVRDISRLTMHDEHLPLEERISAGDRYIKTGGNGASKVYLETLVQDYKDELKK